MKRLVLLALLASSACTVQAQSMTHDNGIAFVAKDQPESSLVLPARPRQYQASFAWGTFTAVRKDKRTYDFRNRLCRGWDMFGKLKEKSRDREVYIDPEKPIADQILRPEIAVDVERAMAAFLHHDNNTPLPTEFTDEGGRTWRLVK